MACPSAFVGATGTAAAGARATNEAMKVTASVLNMNFT
jgi:hypothetical protein